jgi:hypothetical protein
MLHQDSTNRERNEISFQAPRGIFLPLSSKDENKDPRASGLA